MTRATRVEHEREEKERSGTETTRPRSRTGTLGAAPGLGNRLAQHLLRAGAAPEAVIQRARGPLGAPSPMLRPRGAARPQLTPSSGGEPLADDVRRPMERSFGASFDEVRVHTGSPTAALGAIAFTQGNHIYFAPGRYSPSTATGRALIGHELTHVLQQRAGRVRTPQAKGAPINADRALEAEADDLGSRAAQGEAVRVPGAPSAGPRSSGVIQRAVGFEVECQDWFTAHSYVDVDEDLLGMKHDVAFDVHQRDHLGGGGLMPDPTMPEGERNKLDLLEHEVPLLNQQTLFSTKKREARSEKREQLDQLRLRKSLFERQKHLNQRFVAFKKKDVLLRGAGFQLEADEVKDSGLSDMEFVTEPFEESSDGVSRFMTAMTAIVGVCERLLTLGSTRPSGLVRAEELRGYGKPTPHAVLFNSTRSIQGIMQASMAIRLDQVARFMSTMGGRMRGEDEVESKKRRDGRASLGGAALSSYIDPEDERGDTINVVGAAATWARQAIDSWRKTHKTVDRDLELHAFGLRGIEPVKPFGSDKLQGLLALLLQYLVTANQRLEGYAKTIAPLMARTDFARMFEMLPAGEQLYLQEHGGYRFVELAINAANRGPKRLDPSKDVFEHGLYHKEATTNPRLTTDMLSGLTREEWLAGISQGVDLLTAAHFPNRDTASHLESMGALGSTTGYVGKPGVNSTTQAPVFEIRSMTSALGYHMWMHRASDVFRYILDINSCSGEYYQDTVSKLVTEHQATIAKGPRAVELLLNEEALRLHTELQNRLK